MIHLDPIGAMVVFLRDMLDPIEWSRSSLGDGLPDGPTSPPHIGAYELTKFQWNPIEYGLKWAREHGSIFTIRTLGMKLVIVAEAQANQKILVKSPEKFSWGESLYKNLAPFLGLGLLTTDGIKHDRARKLMEPAFRKSQLQKYIEIMKEETLKAVDNLEDGQEFDIYLWMRKLALTIAGRTLLGIEPDGKLSRKLTEAFEYGLSFYNAPIVTYPFVHLVPNSLDEARETILEVIDDTIEKKSRAEGQSNNVLDNLLHTEIDGDRLTNDEIKDQILTLLFAGHDTTAATVAWTMKLLGKSRYAYDRTLDNLEKRLEGEPPTTDQVMEGLPFLSSTIDEVLRLYPAAWIGPRKTTDDVRLGGYDIPEGTHVIYSSLITQRRSKYFDNPMSFNPSRFLDGKKRELPTGSYVPFGRGARTCIGMNFGLYEIKTILSIMLQKFNVSLVPGQSFNVRTMPTLSPSNGIQVKISKRSNADTSVSKKKFKETDSEDSSDDCPVH